jgi:hypothetical protein
MIAAIDDIRQRTWDFALTLITVALLAFLGVQSFIGTIVVWWAIRTIPGWQEGTGYAGYVDTMNAIAAPLIVALVVVMGLCVPKRLFARKLLLWVSVAMVAVGVVAGVLLRSIGNGLAIYLLLSAVIQVAVVAMTVAGVRGPTYLTEGRLTKVGSGLLHLGFIVFAIVVVALQKSPLMLPVFTVSALLVTGGTALSFYADKFAWHRARPHDEETPVEWDAEEPGEEPEATESSEEPATEEP